MQRKWTISGFMGLGLLCLSQMGCGSGGLSALQNGNLNSFIALVEIQNCPSQVSLGNQAIQAVAKDGNGNILPSIPIDFHSTNSRLADVQSNTLIARYPGQVSISASAGGVVSAPCDLIVDWPSNSKTVVQLTNNVEEDTWGQNNNESTTSRGKILWKHLNQNTDSEIMLGDVTGSVAILKTVPGDDVDFMALGSGASPSDILASWRENLNTTYVSNGQGTSASLGMQTQEENSIADGCLFFRKGQPDNDIFRYSSATGLDPISTAGDLYNPITSECKTVYELQQNGMSSLIYFDGNTETPFADSLPLFPRFDFHEGRAVFGKNGDIYLYDVTLANPQALNITNNPGALNNFPKTDGNSIVYTRNQGGLYDVVLYDISSGSSQVISQTVAPKDGSSLRIDLKQVIWKEGADLYFYDGNTTTLINPFPADSVNQAHLEGGLVTWYGTTGPLTDNEIFILK